MTRTLPLVCSAMFVCVGCGDSAAEAGAEVSTGGEIAAAAPPPDPLALLPADAFSVMRVDLATLRQSPYWPTVTAWLDDAERAAVEAGQPLETLRAMRQALDRMEVVVIATTPPSAGETEPDPVVIARGTFVEEDLRRLVSAQASVPRESQGQTIHAGPHFAGAQIADHTWLVATEADLEAVLGRYRSGGGPIASDRLRGMAERVDLASAPAGVAMEVLPDQRALMAGRLRIPGTEGIENASTLGARLDISSGLSLVALADMPSEASAEQLGSQVRGELDRYSRNVMVRMMGVGPVFDATTITFGGTEVRLVTELDAESTAALLDRLGTFIRLALQSAVTEMAARIGPGAGAP